MPDLSTMKATERHDWLVNRARERGFARVAELAGELGVSSMTIRRDLDQLEDLGLVKRVRGGVVPGTSADPGPESAPAEPQEPRIGVLMPEVTGSPGAANPAAQPPEVGYYFERILSGVRAELQNSGLRPRLAFSPMGTRDSDPEVNRRTLGVERRMVDELIAAGVNGLLFSPNGASGPMDEYLDWLRALPIPVVLMERELGASTAVPSVSSVRSAHEVGVAKALVHLRDLGHKAVYLLRHHQSQTASAIHQGWLAATAAQGLDATLTTVVGELADWPQDVAVDAFLRGLLDRGVTALLCHNDNNAYVILRRAAALGIDVPAKLSLISYDDDFAELFDPPVTAVAPPRFYVGRMAARLLLDRFAGALPNVAHVRVEPHLAIRESTGPALH
ncbi:substrate-binding domain-containing protein [Microlunatus sp. GCM10028923]|uniref:substrate-binding domain-containing protein n=1 Tax=Microlunatus sp. GCM10028923 TaxID=3273400 RepID=UPI00361E2356